MRRPISRVRSVTDTSMMFMIPMPPTISETPAMLASSPVMVRVICERIAVTSVCERTMKSSGSPGASSCRARSTAAISPATRSTLAGEWADTKMPEMLVPSRPRSFFWTVVYGTKITSS